MKIETNNGVTKLIQGEREQSIWKRSSPDAIPNSYIRTLAAAALTWSGFVPQKRGRCLMIGLGGGIFCKFLLRYFSNLLIEVVEPNARVVEIARRHFDLDHRVVVHTTDGRSFLDAKKRKFDMLVLDAFDKVYIPPELMAAEYLERAKLSLAAEGIYLANTWIVKDLNPHENVTHRLVFDRLWDIRRNPNTDGNRILLYNPALPTGITAFGDLLRDRAAYADERTGRFSNDKLANSFSEIVQRLRIAEIDHARHGEVLTDANAAAYRARAHFD